MKFRNEKPSKTVYLGGLCPNEYWQQFNNKSKEQ
jgi:hypothetical protein